MLAGVVTTGVLGAATMVLVRDPWALAVPAALVATQFSCAEPEAPAVKVTLVPVAAEVMVPPVIVHARVLPVWAGVLAV